jgi:hypothetical protein
MATIVPYRQQTSSVVGAPDTRRGTLRVDSSNPLAGVAQGIEKYAEDRRINVVRQEKGEVQRRLAAMEAEGALELDRRNNNEPLNSKTFADDFNDWYAQNAADFSDLTQPEAIELARRGAALQGSSFLQRSGIAQSARAGKYAVETYKATLNDLNITVANDPGQFDRIHANALAVLADPTGPYSGMSKLALQGLTEITNTELAKSAINGVIYQQGAPNTAIEMLRSDKFADLLSSDDQTALLNNADVYRKRIVQDARARRTESARIEKERKDDIFDRTISEIGQGNIPTAADIGTSGMSGQDQITAHNFANTVRKGDDPDRKAEHTRNTAALLDAFWDPDPETGLTPRQTLEKARVMFSQGRIGWIDLERVQKAIEEPEDASGESLKGTISNFLKQTKSNITNATAFGLPDPHGDRQYYLFQQMVGAAVTAKREAKQDPSVLFDVNSPEFLGRPAVMERYIPKDRLAGLILKSNDPFNPAVIPLSTLAAEPGAFPADANRPRAEDSGGVGSTIKTTTAGPKTPEQIEKEADDALLNWLGLGSGDSKPQPAPPAGKGVDDAREFLNQFRKGK